MPGARTGSAGWRLAAGLVAALAFACGGGARADEGARRIDVAIHQAKLPNGDVRYSVPVSVGGGPAIEAALDTGSFGLRVMARALDPSRYEATDQERRYGFGGGAQFNGVLAKAGVAVGEAATEAPVLFQLIKSVDCTDERPRCAASRLSPQDYRIAGSGYAGLGYDAILGLSLRKAPGVAADNPLGSIGEGRWIVLLPRPDQSTPGHLIINPGPEDLAGFTLFHLKPQPSGGGDGTRTPGWQDTALSGCLVNEASKERLCGRTVLDSGAPGFAVNSSAVSRPAAWPDGTSVKLQLEGGDAPIEISFKVGQDVASKVRVVPGRGQGIRVLAGSLPYYSHAVFYDQKNGLIGLKARAENEP